MSDPSDYYDALYEFNRDYFSVEDGPVDDDDPIIIDDDPVLPPDGDTEIQSALTVLFSIKRPTQLVRPSERRIKRGDGAIVEVYGPKTRALDKDGNVTRTKPVRAEPASSGWGGSAFQALLNYEEKTGDKLPRINKVLTNEQLGVLSFYLTMKAKGNSSIRLDRKGTYHLDTSQKPSVHGTKSKDPFVLMLALKE